MTSTRKFVYLLSGISFVTFSACKIEPVITHVVDEPLQVYFDRFIDEASTRGYDVEYATSQIDATIADIATPNVIGQCSWDQLHQHSIVLDQAYWRTATDLQREFVVFHELGHCVLGREHVDNADANGNCTSLMSSGTGDCRVVYANSNRNRLIDELFSN